MWNEQYLDELPSNPTEALVEDMKNLNGDIMLLGAGGKIGPNLALMAKRAIDKAGIKKEVIAVSRFSEPIGRELLETNGIKTISVDLMQDGALDSLPDCENIVFLAGKKFGTTGNECSTWAANASLPTLVTRRFKGANFVAFSTGNIYPMVPLSSGGACDNDSAVPTGEYAMSSLARERIFEFAAQEYGSKVLILRLNFAIDLRYGVLYDLAKNILNDEPVSLNPTCFNCVWQGYVNEVTLRALLHTDNPACRLNITGPETVSVKYAAENLTKALDKNIVFEGDTNDTAYLNNSSLCFELFGYPQIPLNTLIKWQAEWLLAGGRVLNKPTHFEERKGKF